MKKMMLTLLLAMLTGCASINPFTAIGDDFCLHRDGVYWGAHGDTFRPFDFVEWWHGEKGDQGRLPVMSQKENPKFLRVETPEMFFEFRIEDEGKTLVLEKYGRLQ